MKFLLHYLMDEGNSLLPFPHHSESVWNMWWPVLVHTGFPYHCVSFLPGWLCSETKETHVQHLRMYVMVSALFLIPQ